MKSKRTEPVISIRLKGVGQTQVFHPGDSLSGVLEIQPNDVIQCRSVQLTIGWHTEGKGDRNGVTMLQQDYPIKEIRPENPIVEHFDFVLPSEPWSFAGHLIRIVWEVHAKIDIAFGRDYNTSLQFVLQPSVS